MVYVIIVSDPVTSEFKEVVGPFESELFAECFIWRKELKNTIVTPLSPPEEGPP